ncbi:MAG: nitric oxide synthase oxygenase [Chthoniobacterales bacterium]
MKNDADPRAMIGQRRLKQIRKQAAVIRDDPAEVNDGAHATLLLEEARKWLDQFYSETLGMSSGSSEVFNSRWAQVRKQIRDGQLDYLSREELVYGAKVAWRNSTRCVGRLLWENLLVRDLRHLNTPQEVFAALVDHVEFSTNGGRIVPMVSVFASGSVEKPRVRIWNRQLIGYAGYRQADGSVLGDPINLGFTHRIEALGWKGPPRGRFNLLPIVIEMDSTVHWFDLPFDDVLEVPIRHPRYGWFEQMGLKWFALPAVSGMLLEIGGVSFPAAPFSGWYVGSEIGARDLADIDRYNVLPEIGRLLGMDVGSNRNLWKDRALIELNDAVLWSFAEAGVAMVDHHTVTKQFLLHENREKEAGRCVYADWSWIVPPISGATTPVFHRSFKDRTVKPNFLAQPKRWAEGSARRCPFG